MLIQRFINTLPNRKDRIMKTSMTIILRWDFDRKESEEEKNISKQILVSSQNHRSKKRRGRHCRGVSPTFPHSAGSFVLSSGRSGSVLPWSSPNHRENSINYHKCPNYETPTFRLLFGPPKQNKYKDADESEKQTKNRNVNDTNNNCFIAYF